MYEYKHLITGQLETHKERLTEEEMKARNVKRVWSVGIVWPMSERGH